MKNVTFTQVDYRSAVARPKTLSSLPDTGPHQSLRETRTIRARPKEIPRLRVAAYCRVSTDQACQETSIENQRDHYERTILDNPAWEPAGIYWETGVTGTKTESRPELNRLLEDCRAGRVDLILTKSISRFSRNTTDCLQLVRKLTSLGVCIFFEKENIRTGTMESELLLTLFSSIAEEESHSISSNSTWSVRKRFASGTFHYSKAPYGYVLEEGSFRVIPEEAEIVREIFRRVLAGEGTPSIAKTLNERNIPTGTRTRQGGPGRWSAAMIRGIVTNVTYTGDVLMQKTWRDREYRLCLNYGEQPQYYMDNHHEAIIDRTTFELAGRAHRQRGREKGNIPPEDRRKRDSPHSRRSCLSGRLICGRCGGKMRRVSQYTASGTRYHWSCMTHLADRAACSMKRVSEQDLEHAFRTLLNKLYYASELIFDDCLEEMENRFLTDDQPAARLYRQKLLENAAVRKSLSDRMSRGEGDPAEIREKLLFLMQEEQKLREELSQARTEETGLDAFLRLKRDVMRWGDICGRSGANSSGTDCGNSSINKGTLSTIFSANVDSVTVTAGREVVFHMKCGLNLSESIFQKASSPCPQKRAVSPCPEKQPAIPLI